MAAALDLSAQTTALPPSAILARGITALSLVALAALCAMPVSAECRWQPFTRGGSVAAPTLREASGLAASGRDPDLLWAINDSGNAPVLYALDRHGHDLGQVTVTGARNVDWEDLAAFDLDGRHYLLIADVGDNEATRARSRLYVVEEPVPGADVTANLAWTITFAYPDHPRDVESAAVDSSAQTVLLLGKRERPPLVFSVALRAPAGDGLVRARRVGQLATPSSESARAGLLAEIYSRPTAWGISPRWVGVLTYGRVLLFQRAAHEAVPATLERAPQWLPVTALSQAEGLTFAADGTLVVTGEGEHPALIASTCACATCAAQ